MRQTATWTTLILLATGCYPAETFQEDSALTRCALYEECGFLSSFGADDYDHCLEQLRSEDYGCVEYQPEAAETCIAELEELTCEQYSTGYFPMACVDACTLAED